MSFKYQTTSMPVTGKKFTDLLKEVKNFAFRDSQTFANKLRNEINVQIQDPEKFVKKLGITMKTLGSLKFGTILNAKQQKDISKQLSQLARALGEKRTIELDHITMAPINQALTLLIIDIVEVIKEAETQDGRVRRDFYGLGLDNRDKSVEADGVKASVSGLKKVVDELREIRAFGEAIERTFAANQEMTPTNLEKAYQALQTNGVLDITEIKDKDVALQDGKALAKLQLEFASDHKTKSDWQRVEGILRTKKLTGGSKLDLEADLDKRVKEAEKIILRNKPSTILGSKAIEEQLGEQFADVFKGKTPRRKKTSARKKKGKSFAKQAASRGTSLSKVKSTTSKAAALVGSAKIVRKSREERDTGTIQQELNKLKTLINRRLPAQVRKNMGRPALRNRTGRFSNSVFITSFKQAQKTIVGEYTYQLDPYETFENTGKRRWPAGYNPKPLIAKSIRELATAEVTQKFTLRRV